MKYIITESKLNKTILKWLNSEYGDLTPYETEEYTDYIFFKKNDTVIFDYNKKNGVVTISYDHIWSFLENFFGLEYEEIQDLIKKWVEEHYKLGVTTTNSVSLHHWFLVEERYKLK
jgi:hypothetical protein